MGRYSMPLAFVFADAAGVAHGQVGLDVGCGPGALTSVLVERLGVGSVAAFDPSPPFVAECAARHPGVDIRLGAAESMPFDDSMFDCALAQLVLHFVSDPPKVGSELRRVLRPGGVAALCVWDFAEKMQMLRAFWNAANVIDSNAPDEARTLRFGGEGEIAEFLTDAGFEHVVGTTLSVSSTYENYDELWSGFLAGIGPAGSYCLSLPDRQRKAVKDEMFTQLGSPTGSFTLSASARCATGRSQP